MRKDNIILTIFLICIIFSSGCSNISSSDIETIVDIIDEMASGPKEDISIQNKGIEIYFFPSEKGKQKLIQWIDETKYTLDCAIFEVDETSVIAALERAKIRGVKVRVFVDSQYLDEIENKNFSKMGDEDADYSHNKFAIFDGVRAVTGSTNWTVNCMDKNNNDMVFIDTNINLEMKEEIKEYNKEFEELWMGNTGKGDLSNSPIIKFSPDDDIEPILVERINDAESNIDFMIFSFTSQPIAEALVNAEARGVEVRGIFESRGANGDYSKMGYLLENNASIIKDKNPANMHHKFIVIDNALVITGSYNWSKNAYKYNDENIIILNDGIIADTYTNYFKTKFMEWADN